MFKQFQTIAIYTATMLMSMMFSSSESAVPKHIHVVKESRGGETRVALVPNDVKKLIQRGYAVTIETEAGMQAGFEDSLYEKAGAVIVDHNVLFKKDVIILRVKRATRTIEREEFNTFLDRTYVIGFLDPLKSDTSHISALKDRGVTAFSLEMIDLPADDPRHASAAMSWLAGKIAFQTGLEKYKLSKKPRILVAGTGPAALAAAREAADQGYDVTVFGRKQNYEDPVKAMGAMTYKVLPPLTSSTSHIDFIRPYLKDPCVVVTAARSLREKSYPILIDKQSILETHPGSVLVELCGQAGGNIEDSIYDQDIMTDNDVLITSNTGYPKTIPHEASQVYSRCVYEFIRHCETVDFNVKDEILSQCYLTHNGQLNPRIYAAKTSS